MIGQTDRDGVVAKLMAVGPALKEVEGAMEELKGVAPSCSPEELIGKLTSIADRLGDATRTLEALEVVLRYRQTALPDQPAQEPKIQ